MSKIMLLAILRCDKVDFFGYLKKMIILVDCEVGG